MIANDMLARGVADGIITAEQALRLRALDNSSEPLDLPSSPDDEQLRFVSGFSDVFVTLGLAMFIGAAGYFIERAYGGAAMWAGIVMITWLLAEFFTRLRRMALPSIVLLLIFAVAVFETASLLLGADPIGPYINFGGPVSWYVPTPISRALGFSELMAQAVAGLLTVLLTALHYLRFRVPITIAAGCAALTVAAVSLVFGSVVHSAVILICGLAIFALAMRFDMADPERLTRRTDIAFWLHLLAAPLIVHSLLRGFIDGKLDPASAIMIIVIFLVLSVVAILIDRRAVLVSGLIYAGLAFWTLFRIAGFSDITTPATLLVLGAFVLLLSAGWRPLRAAVWRVTPSALTRRLPGLSVQTS